MTVQQTVQEPVQQHPAVEENAGETRVVRSTIDKVGALTLSSYSSVKNMSPYAKQIAEAAEGRLGWVVAPLSKYYAKSEPMIEALDGNVDTLITKADSIKSSAVVKAQEAAELRRKLSEKALTRLSNSLSQVREFSATRSKDIIHVDLIAYAEEVIDNAHKVAKPTYIAVQKQLAVAISNVNTSITALQDAVVEKVNRAELLEKLEVAMERTRELAKYGASYVNSNYASLKAFTSEKTAEIQISLDRSMKYLQSAPELFHTYNAILLEKSGLDIEKEAAHLRTYANELIEQANQLLVSVSRVVRGASQPQHEHSD